MALPSTSHFYCLICKTVHPITPEDRVFKTATHNPSASECYPLGKCKTSNVLVTSK